MQVERGRRFEYRVVELARRLGLSARRVPLSGATQMKGDVIVEGIGFECKYRSSGYTDLYSWLEKAKQEGLRGVILSGRRKKAVVVLYLEDFLCLLGGRNGG